MLKDGQIVEQGTHRELLERNGVFATMWADQNSSDEAPMPYAEQRFNLSSRTPLLRLLPQIRVISPGKRWISPRKRMLSRWKMLRTKHLKRKPLRQTNLRRSRMLTLSQNVHRTGKKERTLLFLKQSGTLLEPKRLTRQWHSHPTTPTQQSRSPRRR